MKKLKNIFPCSILFLCSLLLSMTTMAEIDTNLESPSNKNTNSTAITDNTNIEKLEIRKINPPNLSKAHLGKKIICIRPMRHGAPAMFVESQNDKIIAHNYGHGGSGFTLGPGAVKYVVGLLEKELKTKNLSKNTPVAVIGAGFMGLLTTLELLEEGFTDITVVAAEFDNLTSHNAGGLIAPVSMDNDPKMQKLVDSIGIDAYKFYKNIIEGKNEIIKEGAIIVPTYWDSRKDSGLEPYVGTVMQPAKDVMVDFQNGTTRKMVVYDDGIFVDAGYLMSALKKALQEKVVFKKQKVKNIADLSQPIVINTAGLGAKELVGDKKVVPVQGHLIMLKNQNPKDIDHMILVYLNDVKTKSGFNAKRLFYIFPKRLPDAAPNDIGVLGGTIIEGADKNSANKEQFDILLKDAKKFYGIK